MLLFLALCASLPTRRGVSVPPPYASSSGTAVYTFSTQAGDFPVPLNDGDQQFQMVYAIAKICLLTIFACAWTAVHPNIYGPRDSGWTQLKRRVVTVLYLMIAPEVVLFRAMCQRWSAQAIAAKYNQEFARTIVNTKTSIWESIIGWFQPLPKLTTRHGDSQSWTTTHGFFILMGGFMYENEDSQEVLDFDRLAQLIREKFVDMPTVPEHSLRDSSRGDVVSRVIIVLWTARFVAQCIARIAQRLPLTELEMLTLAYAVINMAIYGIWWNKPQAVGTAIRIPSQRMEKGEESVTPKLS